MWNAKRQDLGVDVVVLPQRNLVVFHPDLNYGEALGALMVAAPDMHPDVAQRTVEKVTPRPRRESPGWPKIVLRMALASVATALVLGSTSSPAQAGPEFGPNWRAAVQSLGLDCHGGDRPTVRTCRGPDGKVFTIHGYRHESGSLYVSNGPAARVIFVFDDIADARHYAVLHPTATQQGRAVVW